MTSFENDDGPSFGEESAVQLLRQMRRYLRWDGTEGARLRALLPAVRSRSDELLDRFYAAIRQDAQATGVFARPHEQIPRQREKLRQWLMQLMLRADADDAADWSLRVGHVHVEHRMPQRYMVAGMAVIQEWLQELVLSELPPAEQGPALVAVHRSCQLQLAVMLESYWEDFEAQLRRQERLAGLGEMAASLNDGLRAPLASIQTSLGGLAGRRALRADPRAAGALRNAERGVARASEILRALTSYAGVGEPKLREVDVQRLLDQAVAALPLAPHHQLSLEIEPGLPLLRADPEQLHEVVRQLVKNGLAAMPEGGPLLLSVGRAGPGLRISVTDRGVGIAEADLERVFELSYSTGAVGAGLGLAYCRHVVEAHRGRLELESTPGVGTTAHVLLPLPRRG